MQSAAESSYQLPSPDELLTLDSDAWESLYVLTRPTLWRFARNRLATSDQAEDAVSETLVRAMSAISRYQTRGQSRGHEGPGALIAWLVGIERNVINEMYRAGNRLRAVPDPVETPAPDSVDRVVADDEARALRAAFAELPSDDQELLGLRVVARLDAETTARVLGKRPGAVRMAQARALGRLRISLRQDPMYEDHR